ncbi:DJ-1/PfpI family protein [Rothia halotolerans]|uniref:DJ-1/PfpI family protein n=1 Tax=Rothia halotolerans TaxID=405770 RepID=UPI00101D8E0F|nr:DJ-1/PfpI family protein [Rothia halotolerans]
MATRTAVIHLFHGVEELDAVGPWDVLAHWTQRHPEDGWRVLTASSSGEEVAAAKGLRMRPDGVLAEHPAPDLFLEPGGRGSRPLCADREHLGYVRGAAASGALMTSVCTGSLVYAAAGILRGRPATTHHLAYGELAAQDASVVVRSGERWVDDGDVVTSAGVSAGIDMALYLVGRLAGAERALEVQRAIQYDPAPPVWG